VRTLRTRVTAAQRQVTIPLFHIQGWQYGTAFAHLAHPRDGGRAVRRNSDFVRRRHWLRRPVDASPSSKFVRAHDPRLVSSSDAAAADAAQRSTFNTTAKTAGAAFYAMLQARHTLLASCSFHCSLPVAGAVQRSMFNTAAKTAGAAFCAKLHLIVYFMQLSDVLTLLSGAS
jgi:hypothetical protein